MKFSNLRFWITSLGLLAASSCFEFREKRTSDRTGTSSTTERISEGVPYRSAQLSSSLTLVEPSKPISAPAFIAQLVDEGLQKKIKGIGSPEWNELRARYTNDDALLREYGSTSLSLDEAMTPAPAPASTSVGTPPVPATVAPCIQPSEADIDALIASFKIDFPNVVACGCGLAGIDNCFRRRDAFNKFLIEQSKGKNWCAGTITTLTVWFNKGNWSYHTCNRIQCSDGKAVVCDWVSGGKVTCNKDGLPVDWSYANGCTTVLPSTPVPPRAERTTSIVEITPGDEFHPYSEPTAEEIDEALGKWVKCVKQAQADFDKLSSKPNNSDGTAMTAVDYAYSVCAVKNPNPTPYPFKTPVPYTPTPVPVTPTPVPAPSIP